VRFGEIRIARGGVIALVGRSGTGKTTLFNLLSCLDSPDRPAGGQEPAILLDLDGAPIDVAADPDTLPRARIGYIFQAGFLLKNASAGLNVALPLAQQGRSIERAALAARLQTVDIAPEELDERAWKFSGGEAQRIAFLRAMAHGPSLIFADEPTSNVDYLNAIDMMGQLRRWTRDPAHPGRTVLWITHDLNLAAAVADGVLVLHQDFQAENASVKLPGDPENDADLPRRAAALHRWTIDPQAMRADDPPPYLGMPFPAVAGAASAEPKANPAPDRGDRKVRYGALLRVGLSEVFSRYCAQRQAAVRDRVNPRLTAPGAPKGAPIYRSIGAWLRAFGQWGSVAAFAMLIALAGAGLTTLELVNAHFRHAVDDPRNCHVIIKEVADHASLDPGYGDIRLLSARPWLTDPAPPDAADAGEVQATPRAICRTGDAAYGRRDARGWAIALAPREGAPCPDQGRTYVRLLTASEHEPVWTRVTLLAGPPGVPSQSLAAYFDSLDAVQTGHIYLTADLESNLGARKVGELVGRPVCLYDPAWLRPVRLIAAGIVDELPSWERNRFAGFISNSTYEAFRSAVGSAHLIDTHTDLALYFSAEHLEDLQRYLQDHGYAFVKENLDKIRRLIETSRVFTSIVAVFLTLVALLLGMLVALSVRNYLDRNAQSFALLKAFGMSRRFMSGVMLIEIGVGWLFAVLLIALLLGALSAVMGLLSASHWWRFDDTVLGPGALWQPFLLAAALVWLLSAAMSLYICARWWRQNRYVANVLKST
jgi:putative ABC transport system ATP-binding protein